MTFVAGDIDFSFQKYKINILNFPEDLPIRDKYEISFYMEQGISFDNEPSAIEQQKCPLCASYFSLIWKTDGCWAWTEEYFHYVQKHEVVPLVHFLNHIRKYKYKFPTREKILNIKKRKRYNSALDYSYWNEYLENCTLSIIKIETKKEPQFDYSAAHRFDGKRSEKPLQVHAHHVSGRIP